MAVSTAVRPVATMSERRRARLVAVGGAVLASLLLWVVFEALFDVDLRAPANGGRAVSDIGPAHVIVGSALASLAGWALLALLERLTTRARTAWTAIALVVLVMSFGGPFGGSGVSSANRWGLLLMHLAVAAIIIPAMRRTSARAAEQPVS